MEELKKLLIRYMVENIKSIINLSEQKHLSYPKEKLEQLLDLGNYILASNVPTELSELFIKSYNSLDKTIEKSEIAASIPVEKRNAGIELLQIFETEKELEYRRLNKYKLQYLLDSLEHDMESLKEALDENSWSIYMNYYKFAYLYNKIQSTLDNLVTSIPDYVENLIEISETDELLKTLAIAKECILELILIGEKKNSKSEIDTTDCYQLHKRFSESVIKYLTISLKNRENSTKRI